MCAFVCVCFFFFFFFFAGEGAGVYNKQNMHCCQDVSSQV